MRELASFESRNRRTAWAAFMTRKPGTTRANLLSEHDSLSAADPLIAAIITEAARRCNKPATRRVATALQGLRLRIQRLGFRVGVIGSLMVGR